MSAPEKVDIKFEDLKKACASGGASTLVSVTELKPAAGEHASIAPAKFVEDSKNSTKPVFAFETRFIDGKAARVVLIDSKQSQLNRAEAAIMQDIRANAQPLANIPRIEVSYDAGNVYGGDEEGTLSFTDLELPHRFADGHIRFGTIEGVLATEHESYRALRNATPADLSAILSTTPASALFGAWDAHRKVRQLRLRSALVGEIIGVLADQEHDGKEQLSHRGGARIDPIAMVIKVGKVERKPSTDGLGGLPPKLDNDNLGGVSCSKVIRSWVLSFATLRQLRFGSDNEKNIVGRALLAALGLVSISRAENELYLRANCDLVEANYPLVTLDARYGHKRDLNPITTGVADDILTEAITEAKKLGVVDWNGQILKVSGNDDLKAAAYEEVKKK